MRHNFQNSKRLISAMLVLVMILSTAMPIFAAPSAVGAMDRAEDFLSVEETEEAELSATLTSSQIDTHMKDIYKKALSNANMSSFNGWCGECVGQQLKVIGINTTKVTPNGNDTYATYAALSKTTGGYTVNKYPVSSNSLNSCLNLLNNTSNDNYSYAVLCFDTGEGTDGLTYGHTLLIYAVVDGYVYYTESFNISSTGSPYGKRTISSFCSAYSDKSSTAAVEYKFDGMIYFTKSDMTSITPSTPTQSSSFSVQKAAEYAINHWNNYNSQYGDYGPYGGDCANFVSQSLYEGGLAMTDGWYFNAFGNDYNSASWRHVPSFVSYFKNTLGCEYISHPSASSINVGDVLVYGSEDHVAICVKVENGTPYVCAHTTDIYTNNWTLDYNTYGVIKTSKLDKSGSNNTYETITEGEYALSCKVASYRYLTAKNDSDGGQVEAKPFENINAQKFEIDAYGDGYKIVSKNSPSGRVVNVATDGTSAHGTAVTLWERTPSGTQTWNFEKNGEWYIIRPSDNSSLALTCMDNGGVQVTTYTGDDEQLWSIISQNVEPETYTITYDANGGTNPPANQTKTHGVDLTLTSSVPTRTDYNFKGWNTKADGTGTSYASGAKYTSNSAVTLYAIWEKNIYNVTGVTLNKTNAEMTEGDTLTLTATVAPTNATNKAVTWSSNNTNVATVQNGTVTAKAAGTATITVTTEDGGKTATCVVTVSAKSEPKPPVEAEVVFSLGKVTGRPGDTVKVPLVLDNDKEINSIGIKNIRYDTANLEFVGFEKNEEFVSEAIFRTFDEDNMVIAIGWPTAFAYNGKVCDIVFKIKDTATEGVYDISAESVVKNSSLEITSGVNDGAVTVTYQKLGDIDGNDSLDINDAIFLFQYSMMPDVYEIDYNGSMDFDKDGNVDIDDAILLFQHSMMPETYPLD